MKRAGRPRKSEHTTGQYHNGWMLGCDPKSGRIITTLQVMHEPENNDVAWLTVEKVLGSIPRWTASFMTEPALSSLVSHPRIT